jgi:4-hydroxybenzoate polyprenyltransferase
MRLTSKHKKNPVPLVADVDGTLIKSDLLIESFFMLLSTKPLRALAALASLPRGRAAFKARLAGETKLDMAGLPFNPGILALLKAEKRKGRKLYLASASDRKYVEALARRLGIFDGVFASDGKTNLVGSAKAAALCAAFGKGGFDYAGDSSKDKAVWLKARGVLVVGSTHAFLNRIRKRFPRARGIDERRLSFKDYLRAMRVHQWLKNLLIFVPCLLAHRTQVHDLFFLSLAFLSFSLCASSAYIANDLLDLRNDRQHPSKSARPLASGRIPIGHGIGMVPVLLLAALALAYKLPIEFLALLAVYYVTTMSYSVWLKRKVIVDVVTLAGLYGLRLAAGGLAVAVLLSTWFVAFSVFLFLSLALVKRCTELIGQSGKGRNDVAGRGYLLRDLPMLETMAASSGYIAILVFALYINSPAVNGLYRTPEYLWAICLVLFYWISKILLMTHRGQMHDDPVVFAATDLKSLACGALVAAIVLFSI